MNLFTSQTTPENAIKNASQIINQAQEIAWNKFAEVNSIKPEIDPLSYDIAKKVFLSGFMSGTQLILLHINEAFKQFPTKETSSITSIPKND